MKFVFTSRLAANETIQAYVKQQTVSSVVDPSKFIEDLTDLGDEWTELADLVREPVTSSGKSAPPTSSSEGGSSTGGPRQFFLLLVEFDKLAL